METGDIKLVLRSCVEEICNSAQYGYAMHTDADSLMILFDNSVQKITKYGLGSGII